MAAPTFDASTQTLQLIFQSMKILTAPGGTKCNISNNGSDELIDTVLQANLDLFCEFLTRNSDLCDKLKQESLILFQDVGKSFQVSDSITVRQKLTEVLMVLLDFLTKSLANGSSKNQCFKERTNNESASGLSDDALSVQQEKIFSTSLQFLIVLGVCPYIAPGVGIPISQRLGPGQILLATSHDYALDLNDLQRVRLILPVLKVLCGVLSVPSLHSVLINNYLPDLISALIYVRYCTRQVLKRLDSKNSVLTSEGKLKNDASIANKQLSTYVTEESEIQICHKDDACVYPASLSFLNLDPQQQPWTLNSVVQYININLDSAIRNSSTTLVLKTLMILSGTGKTGNLSVRTPPWFRRIIAGVLRDVLTVPPAIQQFIFSFIGESASTQDWQKCIAIAQIISKCPVTDTNAKQFFTSVSQQLIELLQSPQWKIQPLIVRAIGATISEMYSQQPELMKKGYLTHLHSPLLQLTSNQDIPTGIEGGLILSESLLSICVETLHKLYVIGQEPHSSFTSTLSSTVAILFSIFTFTRNSHCSLRALCKDLVRSYLSCCDTQTGLNCVMALVLPVPHLYPCLSPGIKLAWAPSGGVEAVTSGVTESFQEMGLWTEPVEAALDILYDINNQDLISHLFMHLLQKLTDIISTEAVQADILLPGRDLPKDQQSAKLAEIKGKIIIINFLASIGEKFGQSVIRSSQQVLIFAKITLERCITVCQSSQEESTQVFEWETVSMALSLLTAVLGGGMELTDTDKQLLDDLLPILTAVHQNESTDPTVKEMAEDLKIAVATRGFVWGELSKARLNVKESEANRKLTSSKSSTKSLIEVLSETNLEDSDSQALRTDSPVNKKGDIPGSKTQQALQDLCDPLLPVRGHGIISLSRLVEDRDPEVLTKSDMLLKVFSENLTHKDSYIYLAAVNGLAALSDLDPKLVIPSLTTEFRSQCLSDRGANSLQTALKVGEALVRATRRLGEMIPHYRDLLLTAILMGCRHGDPLVRASSLSGLAEICRLLRYAVGPVLHEIVTCCRDIIHSDPDPEPRKAAALTLSQLIQGFGQDALMALEDVLLDIYRTLKLSLSQDTDEKVLLNVHLALNQLDAVMRDTLFAKPELKKTITILGYQ